MADTNPLALGSPTLGSPQSVQRPASIVRRPSEGVARDFESLLLTRLFQQVQQTMGRWDQEQDGTSQQVQGLFWLYLARDVADQGGIGLWKEIYQGLQQMGSIPDPTATLNEEL